MRDDFPGNDLEDGREMARRIGLLKAMARSAVRLGVLTYAMALGCLAFAAFGIYARLTWSTIMVAAGGVAVFIWIAESMALRTQSFMAFYNAAFGIDISQLPRPLFYHLRERLITPRSLEASRSDLDNATWIAQTNERHRAEMQKGARTSAWVFGGFNAAVALVAYVIDHDLFGAVMFASIATAIFVIGNVIAWRIRMNAS
jgi:hypothetical protein